MNFFWGGLGGGAKAGYYKKYSNLSGRTFHFTKYKKFF